MFIVHVGASESDPLKYGSFGSMVQQEFKHFHDIFDGPAEPIVPIVSCSALFGMIAGCGPNSAFVSIVSSHSILHSDKMLKPSCEQHSGLVARQVFSTFEGKIHVNVKLLSLYRELCRHISCDLAFSMLCEHHLK